MGSNFEYCPRGVFDPCGNMLMQINSISESMVKYSQKMLKKHPNAPYVIYQASLIFFFKVWAPLVLWLVLLPADVTSCKGNVFEFCGSTYVQGTLKGVSGRKHYNFDFGGCIQGAFSILPWSISSSNLWAQLFSDCVATSLDWQQTCNLLFDRANEWAIDLQK